MKYRELTESDERPFYPPRQDFLSAENAVRETLGMPQLAILQGRHVIVEEEK